MKKLWQFLNGNKTIIGLLLLKFIEVPEISSLFGNFYDVVELAIKILAGLSLAHHGTKGYFTHKKGS